VENPNLLFPNQPAEYACQQEHGR
ncbi:uncharacterized protein METZ01_LOCUS285864, partial [marine metagenome]